MRVQSLNFFVIFITILTFIVSTLVVFEHPQSENPKFKECCTSDLLEAYDYGSILSCMYTEDFDSDYVMSKSPPYAVKVYCSTGEVIEY